MEKIAPHHDTPPLDIKNLNLDQIKTRKELRRVGQTAIFESKQVLEDYLTVFGRGGLEGIHGVQVIGQEGWTTFPTRLLRKKIAVHLWGDCWVGVRAAWYPPFSVIDVDSPRGNTLETVDEVKEKLNLDDSQFAVFTSPSYYKENGNHSRSFHIYLKSLYKDKPATLRLQRRILLPLVKELGYELYPQAGRVFRLPFGWNQHYIDPKSGFVEEEWSWQAAFRKFQELAPVALETFPFQRQAEPLYSHDYRPDYSPQKKEAQELLQTGLTRRGARHDAQGLLARYFYFQNYEPEYAKAFIKGWMREKHNGFSEQINIGNWDFVDNDIEKFADDTYCYFESKEIYPDDVHNLQGWVAKADLIWISQVLHGDYINQKRLFKLANYCRPRGGDRHHIHIHRDRWRKIIGTRGEREFKRLVSEKNLMEVNDSYLVGSYSKMYHLKGIPSATSADMIRDENGRGIHDYIQALKKVYGCPKDIICATGIPRRTLYVK